MHGFVELRSRTKRAIFHVRHERRIDDRTVFVCDRNTTQKACVSLGHAENSQMRSKQEKPNPVVVVKLDNLGEYGERRIIDNNVGGAVLLRLIVAAGVEGTNKMLFRKAVFLGHIVGHSLINDRRSIAIVRCLFCFKLFKKLLVFFVVVGKLAGLHLLTELGGLSFVLFILSVVLESLGVFFFGHFVGFSKSEIKRPQINLGKLHIQEIEIPRALVCLVIHDPQSINLLVGEVINTKNGHGAHLELLCRHQAAMANHHDIVAINHDRLNKSVLTDRLGHVGDLRFVVFLGVFVVGFQLARSFIHNIHAVSSFR